MNAPLPEAVRKALESVTLDDKYRLERGRAFMSGVQALVRLPMLQRQRDARAGLNTAGFISGYRGSPLGGYDQALWAAKKVLDENHIVFQPGVNEELLRWNMAQLSTPALKRCCRIATFCPSTALQRRRRAALLMRAHWRCFPIMPLSSMRRGVILWKMMR